MTTPVTGYEILVQNGTSGVNAYIDLGEIFEVSLVTKSDKTGIEYFNGSVDTDLVDLFGLYTSGSEQAPLTGYKSNNGTYAGKDLNEIFQIKIPYVITGTGTYNTTTDGSGNTIITFTSGSCDITFSMNKVVQYTMYGGGAGGQNGINGNNVTKKGGAGGAGGGGGQIKSGNLVYTRNTSYTIFVGEGGSGGAGNNLTSTAVAGESSGFKIGIATPFLVALGGSVGAGGAGGDGYDGGQSGSGKTGDNATASNRADGGGGGGGDGITKVIGGTAINTGGGGGGRAGNSDGTGGTGGGRVTSDRLPRPGASAVANSGCGGGGGGGGAAAGSTDYTISKEGGNGGSGVVILKIIK